MATILCKFPPCCLTGCGTVQHCTVQSCTVINMDGKRSHCITIAGRKCKLEEAPEHYINIDKVVKLNCNQSLQLVLRINNYKLATALSSNWLNKNIISIQNIPSWHNKQPQPPGDSGMSGHTMPGHQTSSDSSTLPACGLYSTGLQADAHVMLGVKPKYPQLEPADNITETLSFFAPWGVTRGHSGQSLSQRWGIFKEQTAGEKLGKEQ